MPIPASPAAAAAHCPFCAMLADGSPRLRGQNLHAFWIDDGYPVTQGHCLIIPKRHVGSFFDIISDKRKAIFSSLAKCTPVATIKLLCGLLGVCR